MSIDGQTFQSPETTFTMANGFDLTALQLGVTTLTVENGAANPLYDESTDTGLNSPPPSGDGTGSTTVTSTTTTTTTTTPADETSTAEKTGSAAVESALTKFSEAYNNLVKLLKDNQKKESRLDSDRTPREIETRLRNILNAVTDGQTKFQIGFDVSKDGTLTVDQAKLRSALEADDTIFDRLFVNGIGKGITDFVNQTNSTSGTLNLRTQTTRDAIDRLSTDIERQERLLQSIQDRYRAQFTSLDSLLANLQQSSVFLSQQLGGLNAI